MLIAADVRQRLEQQRHEIAMARRQAFDFRAQETMHATAIMWIGRDIDPGRQASARRRQVRRPLGEAA